jgi:hypothetical protein
MVALYKGVDDAALVTATEDDAGGAELEAPGALGITMGTPAALQVVSTASMAAFWSASEQAF